MAKQKKFIKKGSRFNFDSFFQVMGVFYLLTSIIILAFGIIADEYAELVAAIAIILWLGGMLIGLVQGIEDAEGIYYEEIKK